VLLFLTVVDWADRESSAPAVLLAFALAIVQGAAPWWRRRRPEAVTAVVLAAGLGFQLLIPEVVLPFAGFFAVGSLAPRPTDARAGPRPPSPRAARRRATAA
jgi:hypothetical protein